MPPKKLTAEEQAFVDNWSKRMFYFVKMMRRADLYIRTIPREAYSAAYKEYANSGAVAGGEWQNRKQEGKKPNWQPEREERETYVDYMQDLIESHPLVSPINAATVMFSSNGGLMCVQNLIVAEQPERIRKKFREEYHKLNNQDLEDTKEERHGRKPFTVATSDENAIDPGEGPSNNPDTIPHETHDPVAYPIANNITVRDSDDEDDIPFTRTRQAPMEKISPEAWKTSEMIGETYFVADTEDESDFIAFELTGISIRKRRKVYQIRFENSIDSIQLTEKEFLGLIKEGVWV